MIISIFEENVQRIPKVKSTKEKKSDESNNPVVSNEQTKKRQKPHSSSKMETENIAVSYIIFFI